MRPIKYDRKDISDKTPKLQLAGFLRTFAELAWIGNADMTNIRRRELEVRDSEFRTSRGIQSEKKKT